jgi:hypothetical protein
MEQNQGVRIELNPDTVFVWTMKHFDSFVRPIIILNSMRRTMQILLTAGDVQRPKPIDYWPELIHYLLTQQRKLVNFLMSIIIFKYNLFAVSLNEARRIITTLSQPIAIIAKIIQVGERGEFIKGNRPNLG